MSGHTPGPWRWIEPGGTEMAYLVGLEEDGDSVCSFGDSEIYYPVQGCEPSDADKSLIAAAPEMLEVLELVRDYVVDSYGDESCRSITLDVIDAAIAKARGEA